ncbi:lipopolysaccharide assembly protein LapA domain-containing protein [Paracoccus nototheniae]|uniref:Lipopolysaccharide assembly protein LapA domain-containing protein n=1 Tax=Paracoccus nototheniae TaxID=2489002 RepID=A0ABW4DZM7_9RHOB|nr:LapA family protein [Paracoccus nototheniae]
MRFIRLIFVALLALVLVGVALANRGAVTLSAFPANFGQFLGGTWSVTLPLFLVIFVAFALGMLAGLVWEWLREAHIRREAKLRGAEVARLEGEVGHLRVRHAAPRDEVLAILDEPASAPRPGVNRASLPVAR